MSTIPTEGTLSGSLCAVMIVIAPVTALLVATFIRNRLLALLAALLVSGGIIAGVVTFALGEDPNEDTAMIVATFGGGAVVLAVGITVVTFAARTLIARARAAGKPA